MRGDPDLGPIFNGTVENWDAHLALLKDFWSAVLLNTGRYKGNPLLSHFQVAMEVRYFDRWLMLYAETANQVMAAAQAEAVVRKAEFIAMNMKRVFWSAGRTLTGIADSGAGG